MKLIKNVPSKEELQLMLKAKEEIELKMFLKSYEFYRRWSSLFLILFAFYFLIYGNYIMAIVLFGFTHIHILFNQIWHKLKNLETFYDNFIYLDEEEEEGKNGSN